ncbi:MAG: ATP-dependent sacrificial sulfur transferase LarE [Planctomycetota bacterium]|nr:ATP-dependent sacrificial sulfur transferase LarE [Planctomycetota bacterium]MDA1178568.1 ATP-dependent sacrificial sulfur transferase LarE [Planctomycetota bacterium]
MDDNGLSTLSLLSDVQQLSLWQVRDALLDRLRSYGACMVAFSGGVDSAVVLKAAYLALGKRTLAATAISPSLASRERQAAMELARLIGTEHALIETQEMEQPAYVRNANDRCYHCKTELYVQMTRLADERQVPHLVNGTNADDLGDYRPGLRAGQEHFVHSPLAELGLGKRRVRELAALWRLPVWDKPASPCLSSRIVYGLQVTPDRLRRIDQAESFLIDQGFPVVRVRHLADDTARVEVPVDRLPELVRSPLREKTTAFMQQIGFRRIVIDVEGFRSGNLNT